MQEATQVQQQDLTICDLSNLAHCLIAPSLPVNGILDLSTKACYSVDMIRLRLKINQNQVESISRLIDTWTEPEGISYYRSNKIGGYRNLWTLRFPDSSISVGLSQIKGDGSTELGAGFLEFNPNKVGTPGVALIKRLSKVGVLIHPVRYDLAIDYPISRDTVRLIKDGRKYEFVASEGITEYLGQRNNAGYVKVYDKQAESNLDKPCTRVELTCDANWSSIQVLEKLPKVFTFAGREFDKLKRSTKTFAIAVQALMMQGDSLEQWLALVNPDTKTKLRKVFAEQIALKYSQECIEEAAKNIQKIADGTWIASKDIVLVNLDGTVIL